MKKVLSIVIALIIGAALMAGGLFYMQMKSKPHVDSKGLMERLEESSELTVQKNYYTGIEKFKEGTIPLINKNGFSMKYEAEIDAGFNLEEVSIEVTDDAVTVTVPRAEILSVSIDPDSLEFYDNKTSLFKTDRKEATKKALQEAKKAAMKNAEKKGLLEAADERAEVIFKGILADGVGDREIIVKFAGEKADTAAAAEGDSEAEAETEEAAPDAAEDEAESGDAAAETAEEAE